MIGALRYLGRISAAVASGLLGTLVPRRKSAAEDFFSLERSAVRPRCRAIPAQGSH